MIARRIFCFLLSLILVFSSSCTVQREPAEIDDAFLSEVSDFLELCRLRSNEYESYSPLPSSGVDSIDFFVQVLQLASCYGLVEAYRADFVRYFEAIDLNFNFSNDFSRYVQAASILNLRPDAVIAEYCQAHYDQELHLFFASSEEEPMLNKIVATYQILQGLSIYKDLPFALDDMKVAARALYFDDSYFTPPENLSEVYSTVFGEAGSILAINLMFGNELPNFDAPRETWFQRVLQLTEDMSPKGLLPIWLLSDITKYGRNYVDPTFDLGRDVTLDSEELFSFGREPSDFSPDLYLLTAILDYEQLRGNEAPFAPEHVAAFVEHSARTQFRQHALFNVNLQENYYGIYLKHFLQKEFDDAKVNRFLEDSLAQTLTENAGIKEKISDLYYIFKSMELQGISPADSYDYTDVFSLFFTTYLPQTEDVSLITLIQVIALSEKLGYDIHAYDAEMKAAIARISLNDCSFYSMYHLVECISALDAEADFAPLLSKVKQRVKATRVVYNGESPSPINMHLQINSDYATMYLYRSLLDYFDIDTAIDYMRVQRDFSSLHLSYYYCRTLNDWESSAENTTRE